MALYMALPLWVIRTNAPVIGLTVLLGGSVIMLYSTLPGAGKKYGYIPVDRDKPVMLILLRMRYRKIHEACSYALITLATSGNIKLNAQIK